MRAVTALHIYSVSGQIIQPAAEMFMCDGRLRVCSVDVNASTKMQCKVSAHH